MIEAQGLTRTYGDFTAVDHVSFQIGAGEIVGLLGHNGAGKTTIMKMLTGYLEPSAGTVMVGGMAIDAARREIQQKIGYLPENCPLYPEMTIIDYLQYAAQLRHIPAPSRAAAIRTAIDHTELNDKAQQSINTLSRGYRQRVGVAQAILHRPEILILDEPSNGLDPSQIQHMRELITGFGKSSTVILSTHILQEVHAICDRVIIIRNGAIALDARIDELQHTSRLLLATDRAPNATQPLLKQCEGITAVDHLYEKDQQHHYALQLASDNDTAGDAKSSANNAMKRAPQVAEKLIGNGFKLYALHPEQRDLESVFREINRTAETSTGELAHA
ncbi:MAG: ABC transporter ATP-binding protein [Gammaproteobacteria bacterium]|nr:ABC transporter ATP-binding protein [Gammaproteobacteria bacterium]